MKLLELRKAKKLNQTEVAEILKVSQRTYAGYELSQTEPTIETLIKLADYYGVSLDYLCEHETPTQLDLPPLSNDQKTAIQMLVKLNVENFVKAFSYISGLYVGQ